MIPITSVDLKDLLSNDGPILIDVRKKDQYQHNHIPSAINAPWDDAFEAVVKWVLKDATTTIVVYDEHEKSPEAELAGKKIESMGYKNVKFLQGGLLGWMEAGGTVEFGTES